MTVAHILASNKINADTAGNTGGDNPDNSGGPAAPTYAGEATDMFENVFKGGVHPEEVPALIDRGLERATDSVRGKLGGLKPALGAVTQPGPAGGTAAARAMFEGTFRKLRDAFSTPNTPGA